MAFSFPVVCEAPADQRTGCDLADRVFCADVDWIEQEVLVHYREWCGLKPVDPCLLWKDIPKLARSYRIKAHGHFDGRPGAQDAQSTRRAILLLRAVPPAPDAVILLRDDDRQTDRRLGMEQARDESSFKDRVVIGLAHTMRECWVLAGFEPQGEEERDRLTHVEKELGFDPRENAERLSPRHPNHKHRPKWVLRELTGHEWEREADCCKKTDLAVLQARGQKTGLTEYLEEVRDRVVPLLRSGPQPR